MAEKKEFLKRTEVRTMEKDIERLKEEEARRERERIAALKIEEKKKEIEKRLVEEKEMVEKTREEPKRRLEIKLEKGEKDLKQTLKKEKLEIAKKIANLLSQKDFFEKRKEDYQKELENLKRALEPILEKEKEVKEKKKEIEKRERETTSFTEKQMIERERWGVERERKEVEAKRWEIEDRMAEIGKKIEEMELGAEKISNEIKEWRKNEKKIEHPQIIRADNKTALALSGNSSLIIQPQREHFDYLYNTQDLINLSGRNYHSKRNHITRFESMYGSYQYSPLTFSHVNDCLELSDRWCTVHHCDLSLDLCEEWMAIRDAFFNYDKLKLSGGVILIDNRVEAFSFGEQLNKDTVVVHMEKASTEFHGLYAMINKMTTEREWKNSMFVNREQDLGEQGLRQAKESYLPAGMVEKFRIKSL